MKADPLKDRVQAEAVVASQGRRTAPEQQLGCLMGEISRGSWAVSASECGGRGGLGLGGVWACGWVDDPPTTTGLRTGSRAPKWSRVRR